MHVLLLWSSDTEISLLTVLLRVFVELVFTVLGGIGCVLHGLGEYALWIYRLAFGDGLCIATETKYFLQPSQSSQAGRSDRRIHCLA